MAWSVDILVCLPAYHSCATECILFLSSWTPTQNVIMMYISEAKARSFAQHRGETIALVPWPLRIMA